MSGKLSEYNYSLPVGAAVGRDQFPLRGEADRGQRPLLQGNIDVSVIHQGGPAARKRSWSSAVPATQVTTFTGYLLPKQPNAVDATGHGAVPGFEAQFKIALVGFCQHFLRHRIVDMEKFVSFTTVQNNVC